MKDLNKYTTTNEWVGAKQLQVSATSNMLNKVDIMFQLFDEHDIT